jgi:hypothetical protein
LPGVGRKIRIGPEGRPVTVTQAIQEACNIATWATLMEGKRPGEGYDTVGDEAYRKLLRELRKQVSPEQDESLAERYRLKLIAEWLGSWNVRTGKDKNGWAEPVRSVMDIPLGPGCKTHGLMHDCPEGKR